MPSKCLTSPSYVRGLLDDLGIRPSKARGQNFLIDKNILDIIIKTADLSPSDRVLEIGPGLGVVTERLLEIANSVTAVEKDRKLFSYLESSLSDAGKLTLIHDDILSKGLLESFEAIDKVVSNLPYSISGRLIGELVRSILPQQILVMLQLEVGQRIVADPGNGDYGILSVWSQLMYRAEIVKIISPTCFHPRPEVRSAIVNLVRHEKNLLEAPDKEILYALSKHSFAHRRKQMVAVLSRVPGPFKMERESAEKLLEDVELSPKARAENLSVDDWCRLAKRMRVELNG